MERRDFDRQITQLAPAAIGTTRLSELSLASRQLVTRWLADLFEQPADHDVVRQLGTIDDAWDWVEGALRCGDRLRPGADAVRPRVGLRPLVDEDLPLLYEASLDPANASGAWRYRGRTVPPDEFVRTLHDGVRAQFAVELRGTGQVVGLVVAYEHHQSGRHCKVGFLRVTGTQAGTSGATFEGLVLLVGHLFATFPYRKVYAELPSYNRGWFDPSFATEEAVLKEHLFHAGVPVDLHIVSMSRRQWEAFPSVLGGRAPTTTPAQSSTDTSVDGVMSRPRANRNMFL